MEKNRRQGDITENMKFWSNLFGTTFSSGDVILNSQFYFVYLSTLPTLGIIRTDKRTIGIFAPSGGRVKDKRNLKGVRHFLIFLEGSAFLKYLLLHVEAVPLDFLCIFIILQLKLS